MSRLLKALRRYRPAELAHIAIGRLWALLYRRKVLVFYKASVERIERLPPRLEPGWNYSCVTMSVEAARAICDAPPDVQTLLATYLDNEPPGQRLVLIRIDGDVAAWAIVAVGAVAWPLTETDTMLPLAPTDAVWISAYTRPKYRGRHLNSTLIGESANEAATRGATHILAWHEHWNRVPGRNMLRVGMQRVGTHERLRVCGINLRAREEILAA